jgi:hypothetical protein
LHVPTAHVPALEHDAEAFGTEQAAQLADEHP